MEFSETKNHQKFNRNCRDDKIGMANKMVTIFLGIRFSYADRSATIFD